MKRHSKSSQRWLQEHFSDLYVKKAQRAGYRSRAAYKLLEIQKKDKILKQGMHVVDLGAAPGGWSQVVAQCVGRRGKVTALDILPMDPIAGVSFIQGDFCELEVLNQLLSSIEPRSIDLVISDMAPNISGIKGVDQPRALYFAELAVDFAQKVLRPGGNCLFKIFQGAGFDELRKTLRKDFEEVIVRKPNASRSRSKEAYFLAKGYN